MPKNKKPAGGRAAKNFEPRYGAKTSYQDRKRRPGESSAGGHSSDGRRGESAQTIGPLDSQTHPRDAVSRADKPSVSGHPVNRLMPDFGYTLGVYIISALSYSQRQYR